MINILHATDFHARRNTGITFAINGLIEQARSFLPPRSKVALIKVGSSDVETPPGTFSTSVPMSVLPHAAAWVYAPRYKAACQQAIREHDISIVHIHGAWLHPQYAAVQAASALEVPTVLTNHGLFEYWALREHKALKKSLYLWVMKHRLFEKVTIFHAITPPNQAMLHELFPKARVVLIPNAIDLDQVDFCSADGDFGTKSEPYVLFLGRLSPEKGIDLLIQSFGCAKLHRSWRLLIAGPQGSPSYAQKLHQMIAASPRRDRIEMLGPIWDASRKYQLMRDASLVAVPSRSEVVALVNLEASACCTPTITTPTTGLHDWEQGGGLLVKATAENFCIAIERASRWSDDERIQRGRASRQLVEQRYSTRVTAPLWHELYRSISR